MDSSHLHQVIKDLVADVLEMEPSEIGPDVDFVKDLGMDSMKALEILATLEKKYRIRIPETELGKMATLNKTIAIAQKYVK